MENQKIIECYGFTVYNEVSEFTLKYEGIYSTKINYKSNLDEIAKHIGVNIEKVRAIEAKLAERAVNIVNGLRKDAEYVIKVGGIIEALNDPAMAQCAQRSCEFGIEVQLEIYKNGNVNGNVIVNYPSIADPVTRKLVGVNGIMLSQKYQCLFEKWGELVQ